MYRKDDWVFNQYVEGLSKPKLLPTDFYWEDGRMVMTESYHKRRGYCCGNSCRHCPYNHENVKQ
jgi:hypothetical protein